DEVPCRLVEEGLAPADVERAQLRGVHEVVAQGPGDQDVRIGERDPQAQSTFPYLFARSATTAMWSSSRNSRSFWIDDAGMRWCFPTMRNSTPRRSIIRISVGRDIPRILAASVVVNSCLAGMTSAPVVCSASSRASTFLALSRGRRRVT